MSYIFNSNTEYEKIWCNTWLESFWLFCMVLLETKWDKCDTGMKTIPYQTLLFICKISVFVYDVSYNFCNQFEGGRQQISSAVSRLFSSPFLKSRRLPFLLHIWRVLFSHRQILFWYRCCFFLFWGFFARFWLWGIWSMFIYCCLV